MIRSIFSIVAVSAIAMAVAAPVSAAPIALPGLGSSGAGSSGGQSPGRDDDDYFVDVTRELIVTDAAAGTTVTSAPVLRDQWRCATLDPAQGADPSGFVAEACPYPTAYFALTVTDAAGHRSTGTVRYRVDYRLRTVAAGCYQAAVRCQGSSRGFDEGLTPEVTVFAATVPVGPPGFTTFASRENGPFSLARDDLGEKTRVAFGSDGKFVYGTVDTIRRYIPCRLDNQIDFGPDVTDPSPGGDNICWVPDGTDVELGLIG